MKNRVVRLSNAADGGSPLPPRAIVALYVLLSMALFAPAFFPDRQIAGTDYLTGGFYFLDFAVRRIREGHLPKWIPYVYGGVPMYANPGGLFYPVRMLFSAILPVERIMPAVYVVQFALAGIGMHLFARILGARLWVAVIAGLMFEFTGITFSNVYAGHDGRIIGATLTPFAFYFLTRGIRSGQVKWFLGLSATLGCVLLSFQLQSAYYLMLSCGLWAMFQLSVERSRLSPHQLLGRVGLGLSAVALSFMLASINLLPFSGYIKDSPRAAVAKRGFDFSTQFSMPVSETVGLAVPEQAGILDSYAGANPFKLHTEYVGAVVLFLLVIGAVMSRRDRVWQFMLALTAFMLTICYGSNTPLYSIYYAVLPGTSKFRSPSIALFMVSFALVSMAVLALEKLAVAIDEWLAHSERAPVSRIPRRLLTGIAALGTVGFVISAGTAADGGNRAIGWARFTLFLVLVSLVTRAWSRGSLSTRVVSVLLAALTVSDLWLVDRQFFWTQPPPEQLFAEDDVVKYLRTQPPGRVWVFPYPEEPEATRYLGNNRFGLHSDYLMRFGISQAGGEHGNQLYRWNQLVGIASGGTGLDWHNFIQYPAILDAAAIQYIVSGVKMELYDVEHKTGAVGIREVYQGSAFVYANDNGLNRAELVSNVRTFSDPAAVLGFMRSGSWNPHHLALVESGTAPFVSNFPTDSTGRSPGTAKISKDDPDFIAIKVVAIHSAMLVLSDNYADGWTASIDGSKVPILRTNHTFRGVPVPSGTHDVVFRFEPQGLYTGAWISAVTLVVLLCGMGFVVWTEVRKRSSFRTADALT